MKSLTPFIFIALSVGIFYVFVDPVYNQIQEVQDKVDENNELIDLSNRLIEERDELQERYTRIGPDEREKLSKILPDTVDNVRLIIDMGNIAESRSGIDLSGINVQETNDQGSKITDRDTGNYGTIGISFSLSARYDMFKELLNQFETTMRLVDITSFSVSAGDGVFYNYSVSLDTYWLR